MRASRCYPVLLAVLLAICVSPIHPVTVEAAAPIMFRIELGSACIEGYAGESATLTVAWRDAGGALKAYRVVTSDASGYWSVCLPGGAVRIGDKVKVGAASYTRRWVVPELAIVINRVRDEFLGRGPAGGRLWLTWWDDGDDVGTERAVEVGPGGRWSYDPRGLGDMREVSADLSWQSAKGDTVGIESVRSPHVVVVLGRSHFEGTTRQFKRVTVSIVDTATNLEKGRASVVADHYGQFAGELRDPTGELVVVEPGDRVLAPSLAPNADWIAPRISGQADPLTDAVAGRCFDSGTRDAQVRISVWRVGGYLRGYADTSSDKAGRFRVDFSTVTFPNARANIKPGDRVRIDCYQTTDDAARMSFVVH